MKNCFWIKLSPQESELNWIMRGRKIHIPTFLASSEHLWDITSTWSVNRGQSCTHMQVPYADFPIKAPRGHQARDGGVKGHTPGGSAVAH